MPKPPERGHVDFDPPVPLISSRYRRLWEIISDMGVTKTVAVQTTGHHLIKYLSFETKEQAMIFKLRF